jgi:hypothetical protein
VVADEIRITKPAYCLRAIRFVARPQIAPGKSAKNGRTAGVGAFALQSMEDFFYRVGHDE